MSLIKSFTRKFTLKNFKNQNEITPSSPLDLQPLALTLRTTTAKTNNKQLNIKQQPKSKPWRKVFTSQNIAKHL
jgi:hypothetical protein